MRYGVLAAAMMLGACGAPDADADGDGEISQAEIGAAIDAADEIKPEPGKYRATMTVVEADIPGAPPEMIEMMRQSMTRTNEICITPAEAENGFREAFSQQNEDCTVNRFALDGGDIDMAMTCSGQAESMEMALSGTVAPTRSDLRMTMQGDVPGMGAMNIAMTMKQERIGDCDGSEA